MLVTKIGRYDFLANLKIDAVVLTHGGMICTVESFDITKSYDKMPVVLKGLHNQPNLTCLASEIAAIMIRVDEDLISIDNHKEDKHEHGKAR